MPLFRVLFVAVACVVALDGFARAQAAGAETGVFTLQDFIGRTWRNENVRFPASASELDRARAGVPLVGPDGKPVLYQIVPAEAGLPPAIAFLADLDPFEKRSYRFASASGIAPAVSDLAIEETPDAIRLSNSRIGISVRKKLAAGQGPIEAIRLASGAWVGNTRLAGAPPVESYRVSVTARGPVFEEVVCDVAFAGGRAWQLRLRLQTNEPVVLVDEKFSLGDTSVFQLLLSPQFAPDHLYYRYGKGVSNANPVGKLATWAIPTNYDVTAFVLEPWLHWWERERQGTWFGLYNEKASDLLAIATRNPSLWVEPGRLDQRASAQTFLTADRAGLKWTLALKDGVRAWMIAALDKDASLAPLNGRDLIRAPLPQQYQIKYGDLPLDRVKDYVAQWPGDDGDGAHPRLIVTQDDVAAFCKTFRSDPAKLAALRKEPVSPQRMDEPIAYALCTGDNELNRHLAATAVSWVQAAVDMYVHQNERVTIGFAPHAQTAIITAMNLTDAVWSRLSPQLRERVKAQVAFLGYTVARDDYWSPPRGFGANPNMTSTVAAYRALLGAMIPAHPMAAEWIGLGIAELKHELDHWSDANGGWLEAPHYALVSYDYLLGVFLMAHHAGFNDFLYDPKMKKVVEWFAKISTPPDARFEGRRHLPPIGNTYIREPTGVFGTIAGLWTRRDPEFAAHMRWMHEQQGGPSEPGLGGFYPMLAGFRRLLTDHPIPAKPPTYGSELFPQTGVVLRSHFPSGRETQLYLIAGANHAHYDQDSGSVTLWGKGRLIADDFGYQGHMPADDHSMVVTARAPGAALMQVKEFSAGARLDYVRGVKDDDWGRQIAFVKDADPLGPNYVVIADHVRTPGPAVWRLWLSAAQVSLGRRSARAIGRDDVDTDIYFAGADGVALTTERKTRETWGIADGNFGRVATTQTGLIATSDKASGFAALVYPRLKSEAAPVVTELAGGKAFKLQSAAGTDYVFLAPAPFSYRDGDISFSGKVGLVQTRGGETRLALGAPGKLTAFGKTLDRAE